MKKATFYWIIAAFCILRMADLQMSNMETNTVLRMIKNSTEGFSFSADDILVSGRWMR